MSEWITGFISEGGYFAVAVLMLLENLFPPIPSELVLPFAGSVAARGQLHPAGVLAASVAGTLLGSLPWYWAGHRLGLGGLRTFARRHGRLLTLTPDEIDRTQDWFRRHGAWSMALGRVLPAVRSVISIPAGVASMPIPAFVGWSLLGSTAWNTLLLAVGYLLESRYGEAQGAIEWVTRGVVALLVLGYGWRVLRFDPRR